MVATLPVPLLIYSVGHSSQPAERFVRLLLAKGIDLLVDVRSQPHSQHAPQFNHEALSTMLERAEIEYAFAGDTLGGRPRGSQYYDAEGRVLYYKVAESDNFQLGLSRLRHLAASHAAVAMMCSEEDPTACHRRLLVGRVLMEQGIGIHHIRADGRVQGEADLAAVRKVSSLVQPGFFDEGEESSWRSTRSVLPARPRSSSSSR